MSNTKNKDKGMLYVLAGLVLAVGIIVSGPLIVIWVINTLFSLGIAYNLWTWLASAFLLMAIVGNSKK